MKTYKEALKWWEDMPMQSLTDGMGSNLILTYFPEKQDTNLTNS